jgi:hypothetical protein
VVSTRPAYRAGVLPLLRRRDGCYPMPGADDASTAGKNRCLSDASSVTDSASAHPGRGVHAARTVGNVQVTVTGVAERLRRRALAPDADGEAR